MIIWTSHFALSIGLVFSLFHLIAVAQKPNILLILPDQMRASSMGCDGNTQVQTPNIDQIAADGIRFHRTYANVPVCCPARAILLTGTYPHVNGMMANDLRLREEQITIAEILRDAGYRTGFIGKWHLDGGIREPGFVPPGPRRQGFDFWAAYECHHKHFQPTYFRDTPEIITIDKFEPEASCDFAVEFLREQSSDKPFFLTVQMGPPHDPYGAPEEYMRQYIPERILPSENWQPVSIRPS
ncbi:MAG: sulfatase-like hydrolase/transferase [Pirellulaceae bacterium]|nr:sulfatase-like hydrolase/transferase [Pirellulaceae bacterium]